MRRLLRFSRSLARTFALALLMLGVMVAPALAQYTSALQQAQAPAPSSGELVLLQDALTYLEQQHDVSFLYESSLVEAKEVPRPMASPDLNVTLRDLLAPFDLKHARVGERSYVIVHKDEQVPQRRASPTETVQTGTVMGTVVDGDGLPLPGAQVAVAGTMRGSVTDGEGNYQITGVPAGEQTLRASFVGFQSQTATVNVPDGGTVTQNFTLQSDLLMMDEAVVTASFNPRTKIESSVAITTLSAEDIETRAPQSTADLLKAIPGFYVESSGGEGGNNLFARGIPADGSFRYVTMQEDGLPVYESPELAFTNIDLLMRVDETVERMEGVRGGTASIFASNAPAGIVNFVSKTGGGEYAGLAKLTGGTSEFFRGDVNVGGPLGDLWRFNLGGFFRSDQGVRDPGFTGNQGGQVKGNVTRLLGPSGNKGYVRLYGKYLNDQNVFYLPVPLRNPDDPEGIDGFDPNYGTLTTNAAADINVPSPRATSLGQRTDRDLTRGMNPEIFSVQGEVFYDLGNGVTLKNAARYMDSDVTFNAIFSLSNPFDANGYIDQQLNTEFEVDGETMTLAEMTGAVGGRYSYATGSGTFDPNNANGNGLVVETGWWHVDKPLSNFTNNFQVALNRANHSVNAGFYFSTYTAEELWHWNDILLEVRDDAPDMLDLELVDEDGNVVANVTDDGFRRYGTLFRYHEGTGNVIAGYVGDEWEVTDQFRLDLGARLEYGQFEGDVEEGESVNLDGDPTTLFDNNFARGTNSILTYDHSFTEWAVSIGANYTIDEQFAVFGRGSRGFRMPDFDQWAGGAVDEEGNAEEVIQAEVGVKYSSPNLAVFAAAFYSSLTDIPFFDEVVDPQTGETIEQRRFANSVTPGLEVEIIGRYEGFRASLTATLQNPEYNDFEFSQDTDGDGELENFDFSGNRVRRIPRYVIDFKPSYAIGPVTVFGNAQLYDERFVDDANNVTLPSYVLLGAGASYDFQQFRVQLNGSNLTNTIGLTEGNPRVGQVVGVEQDIYMARPVLGRQAKLAVTYRF